MLAQVVLHTERLGFGEGVMVGVLAIIIVVVLRQAWRP